MLKSEYDIVLRKYGDLRHYEYAVRARLEHGRNLRAEYRVRFYNIGPLLIPGHIHEGVTERKLTNWYYQ